MPKALDYSKFDAIDEFEDERKQLIKDEIKKYKTLDRERKHIEQIQGSKQPCREGATWRARSIARAWC